MKKVIALYSCALSLALSVILCAGSGSPAGSSAGTAGIDITPLEHMLGERWTGDLDGMRDRRIIRVLVLCSRGLYSYDGMQPRGVIYDAMREFEDVLNRRLNMGKLRINIVFVPVVHDQIIQALLDGRGDIAAADLTITPEREKKVEFSVPGVGNVQELVVTGPAAPKIASVEDLAGREVFVRKSSSYYEHLLNLNAEFKNAGRKPVVIRAADEELEDDDIIEMVSAGIVGITVIDDYMARRWANVFDNIAVHSDIVLHSGGQIAWAFRKQSPQLRSAINDFISTHRLGTPFGNALRQKYFGDEKRVRNATADVEMKKFQELKAIFQRYGQQYSLDWLLLAAQGYQESGLNQGARSSRGAVGIMQVLPSTAAGPPVNIRDIGNPENNIHAGVKLLRSFIDGYFNDASLNSFNRGLMAVASYNAGPAAIAEMRKVTAAMGLDPNKWFHNVEVAVSQHIGIETVQYVSNVFKYYVCYKMALEHEREKEATKSTSRMRRLR
ncbi:MAG: lytic transglycosylase F [bacterium]